VVGLMLLAFSGCYRAPSSNGDANVPIDSHLASVDSSPDGSIADAANPGDPTLARAPRVCNATVPATEIDVLFPNWKSVVYVGTAQAFPRFCHCIINGVDVVKLSTTYDPPQVVVGQQPAIGLTRQRSIAAPFKLSYVVESIDQSNESIPGFAGAFALSRGAAASDYSIISIARMRNTGQYSMVIDNKGAQAAPVPMAAFVPPFRVDFRVDRVGGQFTATTTIRTAVARFEYTATADVYGDFETIIGINRYVPDLTTAMTISELSLP
jgi:hypothetical protein